MNTKKDQTLLQQLRRIVETMRRAGRKPERIYVTWGQLQALKTELAAIHYYINPADMKIFDIPLELSPSGNGLWVSCTVDSRQGETC